MCFTRTLEPGIAKVAQQDIPAFKILKRTRTELTSPSRYTVWKLGELKVEPKFERTVLGVGINVGLHSLKSLKDANDYMRSYHSYDNCKIYPVVIPKGSLYWENGTQFCSDQLRLESNKPYLKNGTLSKAKTKKRG